MRPLRGRKPETAHFAPLACLPTSSRVPLIRPDLASRWKRVCKSANFLVKYPKGDSALELATHNYGCNEWWLLLEPTPAREQPKFFAPAARL